MNTTSHTKAKRGHSILLHASDQTAVCARHTCQGEVVSGVVHRNSGSCWMEWVEGWEVRADPLNRGLESWAAPHFSRKFQIFCLWLKCFFTWIDNRSQLSTIDLDCVVTRGVTVHQARMDSRVNEKIFLLNYRLVKQLCPTLYIDRNVCVLHCLSSEL